MEKSILAYNDACRKVLSDKRILSYLLKHTLEEYKDLSMEEIEPLIEGNVLIKTNVHTIFSRKNELFNDKGKIVYDLLFTTRLPDSENWMDLIINIEVQKDPYPKSKDKISYPILKRSVFYTCSAISEEKGNIFTSDNYQDLKKVVSIWINTQPPKHRMNTINRYEIKEKHVSDKTYCEKREDYDLIEILMINLGEDDSCKQTGFLNELFVRNNSSEEKFKNLKEKYGIEAYEETKGEVIEMCNLGEGLVERGIEQGIEQGMAQGEERKLIENIKTLMKKMQSTYEEVAKLLDLNEEEIDKYRELVLIEK